MSSETANRESFDRLISVVYEELRRLASRVRRGDPSHTLNTTALVHEGWVKLARYPEFASTSTLHFKRIAARAMRQVLVEAARRRKAGKRGGDPVLVTLDERDTPVSTAAEVLAIHAALDKLAELNPRQAQMVESRFFAGMALGEMAQLFKVSEATVLRDWRAARAWLARELKAG